MKCLNCDEVIGGAQAKSGPCLAVLGNWGSVDGQLMYQDVGFIGALRSTTPLQEHRGALLLACSSLRPSISCRKTLWRLSFDGSMAGT
jgi:hypothetical protein